MGERTLGRRRWLQAAWAVLSTGLLAACAVEPQVAAPVFLRGPGSEGIEAPVASPPPMASPKTAARRIVVRRGQSLGGIAHEYRVSKRAIIAANRLKPPYKIKAGQRLLVPGGAPPMAPAIAVTPLAPPTAARASPEVIPLDGPAPQKANFAPPPPSGSARPQHPATAEQHRTDTSREAALPRGAHFPWPVRGRVLAGYGAVQGGGRNDGINIAAPRGAPVRAVDEGVVAYSGNEVRGYGNLVLVKHPGGFITAYAHCERLLVKRGDKVEKGQVIAKVGATGSVGEPQLHFELRRGKRAVDPREFLTPAPRAGNPNNRHDG